MWILTYCYLYFSFTAEQPLRIINYIYLIRILIPLPDSI